MNEFIKVLIERLEEKRKNYSSHLTNRDDVCMAEGLEIAISIVNQLAEEHKQQLSNDLEIVSSLPSLYPLQSFEEEAIHRVVGNVNNNGWIPCERELPEKNESVLCWAKSTARGGDVCFVGSFHNGFWFLQTSADTHSFPGQYVIVAWKPIAPYQPKGEKQ